MKENMATLNIFKESELLNKIMYLAASLSELAGAVARVHSNGLADDKTILHKATDVLAGVGVGDFVDLIGVEPDLSLSALENCRREAFLQAQITAAEKI